MSRLETNAEPSMEEILASIRKIIAEEPGSRSIPPMPRSGAPSPTPAPQRGFMSREAFMRSTHQPDAEPETRAPQPAPSAPSRSDRPAETKPSRAASSPREEPVAEPRPAPERKAEVREKPEVRAAASSRPVADAAPQAAGKPQTDASETSELEADAASIDAQLVKLLGDDLKSLRDAESAGASEANGEKTSHLKNGARETREGGDPFAFDLGPSPFSPRPEKQAGDREDVIEARAPSRPGGERSAPGERDHFAANGRPAASTPANPAAHGTAANGFDSDRFSTSRPRELFGVPSVSATIGPDRNLEPLSASFRSSSDRFGASGGAESQFPRAPGHASSEPPRGYPREMREEPRRDRYSSMLQPAPESDAALDRAIEDTVADLLRPMLRTWLAENMPRIVERALRREMSERLLPGQKNPLD